SERISFLKRASADMVMALALIHHLAIANNIPLGSLAEFFSKIAKKLIIEFVPKSDANAQLLLRNREDIFLQYNQSNFEKEFEKFFRTISREKIDESERVLFLMESNQLPKASPTYS
ncbi:MAG: SAM-dependent methyltransferase, partial [Bacteroidetes bacterium]|nr:SAM-dependent methyltransferase [Bacteroidota bacterium]